MYQHGNEEMHHGGPKGMGEGGGPAGENMSHHGRSMGWGGRGYKGQGCPGFGAFMAMKKWRRMMHGMGMMPGMGMMGMMGMGQGMKGGMAPWRRFISVEEKVAMLEEYLKQLQMEEKGVQEKIDLLKKESPSE